MIISFRIMPYFIFPILTRLWNFLCSSIQTERARQSQTRGRERKSCISKPKANTNQQKLLQSVFTCHVYDLFFVVPYTAAALIFVFPEFSRLFVRIPTVKHELCSSTLALLCFISHPSLFFTVLPLRAGLFGCCNITRSIDPTPHKLVHGVT